MTDKTITPPPPGEYNGRTSFTAWLTDNVPANTECAWVGSVDANGGAWLGLRTPDLPLHSIGFYFEADGSCSGFRIEPTRLLADNPLAPIAVSGQLTARLIRQVPFAQYERMARKFAREIAKEEHFASRREIIVIDDDDGAVIGTAPLVEGGGEGSELERDRASRVDGLKRRGNGGRKPTLDHRFYAEQARRYVEALGDKPIQAVAQATHYRESQVRNHIAKARDLGLLTPTPPGRAGGELTREAIELLEGKQP